MRAKLTQRTVDSLRPRRNRFSVRDTEIKGFLIQVRPNGGMAWFYDYRNAAGHRLTFKLGGYPGLKPEGARRLAEETAGKVAAQIDVQAAKQTARKEAERAKVATLGAFVDKQYGPWALQHLRRGDTAVARLKADFPKWQDEPLSSFNSWRIESWRKDRLKDGVKPVSINRQLDTLRACLRKAVDWNVIAAHPMQGLKRLKVDDDERVRFLSPAEENRLRDALVARETNLRAARDRFNEHRAARHKAKLPARTAEFVEHVRPLVLLALNTGLRRGELFSLKWADIAFEGEMLTVRAAAAKSGDSRRVPLNTEALGALKSWKKQSKAPQADAFVFPGADGERLTNINKAWTTLCKLAKVTNFRLHDCRHHFASRLVQKGVDLNTVRELLGHHDLKMTLRYSHLTPGNLSDAVAKLSAAG
jgi:integrase